MHRTIKFSKGLFSRYGQETVADKAAALSYYTIFSIGPLLFIIFGILGLLIKNESYKAQLSQQMQELIGPQAGQLIDGVLNSQSLQTGAGPSFVIGIVGLVLVAIGIFGQLQKSLNSILHVKVGPDAGKIAIVKQRLVSLAIVGVISFMLLVSLIASTGISALSHHFHHGPATGFFFQVLDALVSFVVFTLLLAIIYRTLPDVRAPFKPILVTSAIVAILFAIGKSILGLVIGNNSSITAFGAAGSLIALLLWIFYSGQILYMGAVGLSYYVDTHNIILQPRYGGKRGVLHIRRVEEPLPQSEMAQQIKSKFVKGLKNGVSQQKNRRK
jgi:membrane protein